MMSKTKRKRTWRSEDKFMNWMKHCFRINYLVGELGPHGEGEGVLAKGESGMTQTDFLRLDDGDFPDPIV